MALTPVSLLVLCKYISLISSVLITLFLLLHDWINIYPLNDLATFNPAFAKASASTVNTTHSLRDIILMTAINTSFFIIYTLILLYYWSAPFSLYAKAYLITCNVLFSIGIIFSWWAPYLFGFPITQVEDLHRTHGTTHAFLPPIGTNPIPNTLHVIFHTVFVINMITTFILLAQ
jgi:hypothetical protein